MCGLILMRQIIISMVIIKLMECNHLKSLTVNAKNRVFSTKFYQNPERSEMMDEVKYEEIDRWGWECPKCGNWNETEDDPSYQDTVFCDGKNCDGGFIPVQG